MAEQFPDELIQLVATATQRHHIEDDHTDASGNSPCVCGRWWDSSDMEGWDEHMAAVALAALDEAGRLLPPGAHIAEEIAVRVDKPHPKRKEQKAGQVIRGMERATALHMPKLWEGWVVVRRNVVKWAGPWVPVGTEPSGAAGEEKPE